MIHIYYTKVYDPISNLTVSYVEDVAISLRKWFMMKPEHISVGLQDHHEKFSLVMGIKGQSWAEARDVEISSNIKV